MFVNLVWSSSRLCGGGGKEGAEGGRTEMVVAREDARESSQGLRSLRYTAPKRETRLTPCTRAPRLRDASVQKESCRQQWRS